MAHILFPHQKKALSYAMSRHRIALFMEMRMGKSAVVIRWASSFFPEGRILLLAPLSTFRDWQHELKEEGIPRQDIIPLYGITKPVRAELSEGSGGWYLLNYEALRADPGIADLPWDCVICDESTRIRNPQAQITKLIQTRLSGVEGKALLSGLPNPESEMDFFEQMRWLHGSFLGQRNYWVFRNIHFRQGFMAWDWIPKPGTREAIKNAVHISAFIMTRAQARMKDVRVFETREVEMNAKQKLAIEEIKKKFSFEYIETDFATVRDIWCARIAGGFSPDRENPELLSDAKTNEILSLLGQELKGQQVVIWFRFLEELHHVADALEKKDASGKKKYRVGRLDGSVSVADRAMIQDQFADARLDVLCVQVALGKFGLNLSSADTAIYYSNSYEMESRAQSLERIAHLTKRHRPLLFIDLITKGSIDEDVVDALREKKLDAKVFQTRLQRYVVEMFQHGKTRDKEKEGAATSTDKKEIGDQETNDAPRATKRAVRIYPRSSTVPR